HPKSRHPGDRPSALLVSPQGMPCPCLAVFSLVVALAGCCPLSPTDAQTTQLLVQPPWRPAVLWDRVTLTCQGSGTAGATTWYKDGQRWGQNRRDSFTVTESGTYTYSPTQWRLDTDVPSALGTHLGPVSHRLVLQVPARTLLEGDTVTLRCRAMWDMSVDRVRFYKDKKDLRMSLRGNELSLSPLQQHHSGRYHCEGSGPFWASQSAPVTVTPPSCTSSSGTGSCWGARR
uniref:Ig-like domain-containing protein n=1 Tax=Cyanoderma ruficeps TaxID=181631 RepID=A0A8C3QQM4_9PASS